MSGKFKSETHNCFPSYLKSAIDFLTTLVILHFCGIEAVPCLSSSSVHCFNLSCLLMDFSHGTNLTVVSSVTFLDGCNGVETSPLSRIIRLLSQPDEGWGDERLT